MWGEGREKAGRGAARRGTGERERERKGRGEGGERRSEGRGEGLSLLREPKTLPSDRAFILSAAAAAGVMVYFFAFQK